MHDISSQTHNRSAAPSALAATRNWPGPASAVALLSLILGAAAGCADDPVPPVYGGQAGYRVLQNYKRVEAVCLVDEPATDAGSGNDVAEEGATSSGAEEPATADLANGRPAVVLNAAQANQLATILLDPQTYDFNMAKACEFVPTVQVQFIGESSTTEVIFCFSCDELIVYRGGKRVGGEDFDKARPELLALMQQLFPASATLQALEP